MLPCNLFVYKRDIKLTNKCWQILIHLSQNNNKDKYACFFLNVSSPCITSSRPVSSTEPTPSANNQTGPVHLSFSAALQKVTRSPLFTSNCIWNWLMAVQRRREHFLLTCQRAAWWLQCDPKCLPRGKEVCYVADWQQCKMSNGGRRIIRGHQLSCVEVPGNVKGWHERDGTSDSRVNHLCPFSPLRRGGYGFWPLMTFSITVCPLVMGYIRIYALVRMHWKLQRFRGHWR